MILKREGDRTKYIKLAEPSCTYKKKDGTLRFCVDFRRLNELVNSDELEIPRINEILTSLRDKRYFTSINLKDGFFHVPIEEKDREKTTFYSGKKLMQFTCMPQGYKNTPEIFQKAMHLMFEGLIGTACMIYIDDILVFGESIEKHN
jgi:hypothetical protein